MASGATITATGMVTMQQVVAGTDTILIADFNNARTNVDRLLGVAQDVTLGSPSIGTIYGYGQGGVGVAAAAAGELILAAGAAGAFKELQDDVQALCAFLGVTVRAGVGTDVTTSTTITAATWNNLMLNIQDCWNDRFDPQSLTITTDGNTTRTTTWTNTLTQITTWTFASESDCRAFFNGGGALGMSASRTGGTANDQNTSWTNALSNLGDVLMYHDTSTAGAGSVTGVGFYELSTSYQNLVTYTSPTSPYSSDSMAVAALVNSTTNPTSVSIRTTLTDAGDNVIDESVDGTLTINARRNQPDASGSGFSFPVPTDSVGAISGS
jgi:hypothetical protein